MNFLPGNTELSLLFDRHQLGPSGQPVILSQIIREKPGEGRYVLQRGEEKFFVRLTSNWNNFRAAADLNNYLAREGCSVIPVLVSGERLDLPSGPVRLDVRPYFAGCGFDFSEEKLDAVLDALSDVHKAMKKYPDVDKIIEVARERTYGLELARKMILSESSSLSYLPEKEVINALFDFDPEMGLQHGAQCIHSDLHPENVLFNESNEAILFDFEESAKNYLNPVYDLIYIYDRFAIRSDGRINPDACFRKLTERFRLDISPARLIELCSQMYLRLILMVYDNHIRGGKPLDVKEIEKFTGRFREMIEFRNAKENELE